LLLVVAFEAVEKGEEDVVGCMGVDGGMVDCCKLGRRESTDGCMRVWAGEKDGERGEEVWGIIETVYDIVLGGRDGCRAHVWWVVVTLWERECKVCGLLRREGVCSVWWLFTSQIEAAFALIIYTLCLSITRNW
jgi:hypothetical protein